MAHDTAFCYKVHSIVNFAGITVASEQVFTVGCAKCDLSFIFGCIKLASNCQKSWKCVCTHHLVLDEMKTTTVSLEDHNKRQHVGQLLPRNQVAVICSGKACFLHVLKKK
jgi:hypothetical protein